MASRKRSLSSDSDVSGLIKEWYETSCPICMDHPHNAVLLICSSHGQGCRSYICDTSYRHSNCLDRFKKLKEDNADPSALPNPNSETLHDSVATSTGPVDLETWIQATGYQVDSTPTGTDSAAQVGALEGSGGSRTHDINADSGGQEGTVSVRHDLRDDSVEKSEEWANLRCPLCRGTVLGWKVVEEARKYLNLKSRSCSYESCSFMGNYRELRRHARRVHPMVRPADVDPSRQRAWRHLEDQREYSDIVSAIQSAMPGAVVLGDYVIENGDRLSAERDRGGGGQGGRWLSTFFLFHMIGSMDPGAELRGGRARVLPRHRRAGGALSRRRYLWGENLLGLQNDDEEDEEEDEDEDNETEMNILSDLGDNDSPNPRRRRRLTRAQSDEEQQ